MLISARAYIRFITEVAELSAKVYISKDLSSTLAWIFSSSSSSWSSLIPFICLSGPLNSSPAQAIYNLSWAFWTLKYSLRPSKALQLLLFPSDLEFKGEVPGISEPVRRWARWHTITRCHTRKKMLYAKRHTITRCYTGKICHTSNY